MAAFEGHDKLKNCSYYRTERQHCHYELHEKKILLQPKTVRNYQHFKRFLAVENMLNNL